VNLSKNTDRHVVRPFFKFQRKQRDAEKKKNAKMKENRSPSVFGPVQFHEQQ